MKKKYLIITSLILSLTTQAQNFQEVTFSNLVAGSSGECIFGDIDGDNDQDALIIAANFPEIANLYINDGTGVFTENTNTPFVGVADGAAAFFDIDNDNDLDLIIAGADGPFPGPTRLYTNDGNANFTLVSGTPFISVYNCALDFADIDGDNDLDILISGQAAVNGLGYLYLSKLYKNDGLGSFTEIAGTNFIGAAYGSVNFADIDGDNDKDVLITGHNGTQFLTNFYTNNGNGVFTSITHPFPNVAVSSVAFADIDGDSDLDVLLTGDSDYANPTPTAEMFTNDGNGNFTIVNGTPFDGVLWSSVAFSDVDNDNDLDVLITGNSSNDLNNPAYETNLFINNGSGTFAIDNANIFPAYSLSDVAFSDVDNNGYSDIFIMGNENMFMNNLCQINITVSINNGAILTANQSNSTYQWLDCDNGNTPIQNETNQTFNPNTNGNYAVEITNGTCIDTSDCVLINAVGINEIEKKLSLSIYPNPTNGQITIESNNSKIQKIIIYSTSGETVYYNDFINSKKYNVSFNTENGIYFVAIFTNEKRQIIKLIKT